MMNTAQDQDSGMHLRRATAMLVALVAVGLALAAMPSAKAQTLTTLYNFCAQGGSNCTDGARPYAGLVEGTGGDFFGTTDLGGASFTGGTAFKITPSGALTTLYNFCSQGGSNCTDGEHPDGGLVRGPGGDFCGTTTLGGKYGGGTVFKITPSGARTTLYNFCSVGTCSDGADPSAPMLRASDGNLYGTTVGGGPNANAGTVFKITLTGALTTLHSFCSLSGCSDGKYPFAGLAQGTDGDFYGTTELGGKYGGGTVFKITPSGTLTTLHSFCSLSGCSDGSQPYGTLVQGSDGDFYGTTWMGGAISNACNGSGCGTVFKITPSGALTTLYSFCSAGSPCPGGANPYAALVQATDGDFYGTTYYGGANGNYGTVFKIAPSGALTTLHSFSRTDGSQPSAGLVEGTDRNFYGTTFYGGAYNWGTVFMLAVVGPVASLSPTSLTFGAQGLETTSAIKKVTLTSTGTTNLIISNIGITGADAGDFEQSDNCLASLAPGAKCTIDVSFTPSALGARTATLNVDDNAANSPQTVSLSGTGVAQATLSPSSLTFAAQKVGTTSAAKNVTLTNNLTMALTIYSITVGGADPGDFAVSSTTCGTTLAAKAHCTISTKFTPTAIGTRTATLDVNDSANPSPQTVSLTGTGK